jgi:methyl-accepting chemotaxis protein
MNRILANLRLSMKLSFAPAAVMLFLIAMALVSYFGLSSQKAAMDDMFNQRFKEYQNSARLSESMASIHANLYKSISWVNANYDAKKIEELVNQQKAELNKNIDTLQKNLKSNTSLKEEEKKAYQETLNQLLDYQKQAVGLMDMVQTDVNAAIMFMSTADDKHVILSKTLESLQKLEDKLSKDNYESSGQSFNAALGIFGIVVAAAIVLSLLITIFMTRLISRPVQDTIGVIKEVADGDLTQDVNLNSKDEMGDLARALNAMRVKMGDAVGQAMEISRSLADSASSQAASIEETSASLDELSSMTKRNADNTSEADKLMAAAKIATEKANTFMKELTSSMKEIAESSEQTKKIIKSIDEIAFQTNLLALNAAVEAARAGEAGAGFAVVADEVRNLAMRATESARNTSSLIEDIAKKVTRGEELVSVTNEAFSQVSESALKVGGLMEEIAAASKEQSQGIDQINKTVAEMSHITQQNAASSEELTAAMSMFKTDSGGGKAKPAISHETVVLDHHQKSSAKDLIPFEEEEGF